jgi:hypothetical protein
METCELCKKSFNSLRSLSRHLKYCQIESLTPEEYYLRFINNSVNPYCSFCKEEGIETRLTFISMSDGFRETCGKHQHLNKKKFEKIKQTTIERYGGCGKGSKILKEKIDKTMIEKYGVDNASLISESIDRRTITRNSNKEEISKNISIGLLNSTKKIGAASDGYKNTCMDKFGVENAAKNNDVRNKIRNTFEEKYGGHPLKTKEVQDKLKQTCLERYGVDNASKNKDVIDKIAKTNMDRYGVKTNLLLDENKEKAKLAMMKKYGVEQYTKTTEFSQINKDMNKESGLKYQPEFLKEHDIELIGDYIDAHFKHTFKCLKCNATFEDSWMNLRARDNKCLLCSPVKFGVSGIELELKTFCESLNIPMLYNDRMILDGLESDILFPDNKFIIELDGLFWHSELMGKDKNYHLNKTLKAKLVKHNLIHIFEDEWNYKKDIIKSIISLRLNKSQINILAEDTTVKTISTSDAKLFLDTNHIQGYISGINFGLFTSDDMLVSVMTIGKPRFSNTAQYEILRFCNKLNYNIKGGLKKLFNYCISQMHIDSIISYSDRRFGEGSAYLKLGFTLSHYTDPSYYYIKGSDGIRHSRFQFQKHKLKEKLPIFDINLSEGEIMKLNGYTKIWDCGRCVYNWSSNSDNL